MLTTVDENALNAQASSRVEQLANSKTYPLHTHPIGKSRKGVFVYMLK